MPLIMTKRCFGSAVVLEPRCRRSFVSVRGASEWNKCWADCELLEKPRKFWATQVAPVTTPDMPPKVLEAVGGRVN
jgi:hypothetical protein